MNEKNDINDFNFIFKNHQKFSFSFFYKNLNDEEKAMDLTQETFIQLYKALSAENAKKINYIRAYINTIQRNILYNYLKSNFKISRNPIKVKEANLRYYPSTSDDSDDGQPNMSINNFPDKNNAVDKQLFLKEGLLWLRKNSKYALESDQRLLVYLRHILEFDYKDIQKKIVLRIKTMRSKLSKGMLILSEIYAKEQKI